ncbi:protein transport protein SEC20, partial [Lecanoromycetidae sp. Uapishka_2]
MSSQTLYVRLAPLFESLKQTQQLITRLSKLPAQPGSSPSNPEEGDARVELSAEIHQSLKEQEEDFELIRQEVEDQTNTSSRSAHARRRDSGRDRERTNLATHVARLGEDLKIARAQFRKAQLQAKRNAEAAKRKERELLFAGIQDGNSSTGYGRRKGQEKLSQEEILLNASSDVTAALRRTHNLMTSELERTQKPTGTGAIPKFPSGHVAPTIRAGGGGYGAKMQNPNEQGGRPVESAQQEEKSRLDQVGEMAEESQKPFEKAPAEEDQQVQGTVLRERTAEDGPPNPKKRMWEEPMDPSQEERQRDEL